MGIEIRNPRDDEREAAKKIGQLAFAVRPQPYDEAEDRSATPLERRLVAADGGDILGTFVVWEAGQWFGGRKVPAGAVSGVAVHPAHRGRGIATRLIRAGLDAMRERGEAIASLYPMNHTLYRRHGWELAGAFPEHRVEARALLDLPRPGRSDLVVRPTREDDLPALRDLHEQVGRAEQGTLSYGPELARRRLLGHEGHQEGYVIETPGAGVTGLVVLNHTDSDDDMELYSLRVHNLLAADHDSELALWRLLAGHYPLVRTVVFSLPDTSALPVLLGERGVRPAGRGWRWMARLVDAPAAIAARGYAEHVDAEVALDIDDASAPWNAGPHVLRIKGGRGVLEPGGPGTVRLGAGTLSSLYTGWAEARTEARTGRLTGAGEAELAALDTAFAGRTPQLRDFF